MKNCNILDIKINTDSKSDVLKQIGEFIESKTPHQITTVNTEFVMEARKNPTFAKVINDSDLALADGAGIMLAAGLLNQPNPPRITGVDFTQELVKEASEKGWSVFFLGGRESVAEKTAAKLKSQNSKLIISGFYAGSPTDPDVIPMIKKAKPDILLVAWGAPKQDIWIHQHKSELNVPVMMGVGGTFDFILGIQKRAPKLWQDFGFEWLWRLIREPWRWKRQLALPKVILLVVLQRIGIIRKAP